LVTSVVLSVTITSVPHVVDRGTTLAIGSRI
jgi:hypothetical protein